MLSFTRRSLGSRNSFALGLICAGMVCNAPARAQTITDSTALSFGSFVAGSGGTVAVSPASDRSATGGVTLINAGPGAASQSTVTGTPGSSYSITLPANDTVSLSNGSNTMAVNEFVSNPAATSSSTGLLLTGSQTLYIGATLTVSNNQPAGSYSGTFPVTVTYP